MRIIDSDAPHFMFGADDSSLLVFRIKVKNVGERATRAGIHLRLRNTLTGRAMRVWNDQGRPVIRPGRKHAEWIVVRHVPNVGLHVARACAVARGDRNRGNNCRRAPSFTAIPRKLSGLVTATLSMGGTAVETAKANVTLDFRESNGGVFRYDATGGLKYAAAGKSGGCTYSGASGTLPIDQNAGFVLRPDLSYFASGLYRGTGSYRIAVTCPLLSYSRLGPANRVWWSSPVRAWGRDLGGVTSSFSPGVGPRWDWDLHIDR